MPAVNRRLPFIACFLLGLSLLSVATSASSHSALANQARHKALSRSRAHHPAIGAGATVVGSDLLPRAFDISFVPMPVERRGDFARRREVKRACPAASSVRAASSSSASASSAATGSLSSSSASASVPSPSASASAPAVSQGDDGISTVEVTATSTRQTTVFASPPATVTAASSTAAAAQPTVSIVDRAGAGPFNGDATWFATGLGACGWVNTAEDNIVAVSSLLFDTWPGYAGSNPNNNPICNQKIRVSLASAGTSIEVTVADRCVGCAERDLDFTEGAFKRLVPGGLDVGRLEMAWQWI